MSDPISNSKPILGIFGGTFDPVHCGHLRTLLDTRDALNLDKVLLIPNHVPPHREQPILSSAQRLRLLQKAIMDLPALAVDTREIDRQGASYMVDTLRSLQSDYADYHLCLIIGSDAYHEFCSWHNWQHILQIAHLIVMQRAGHDKPGNVQLDRKIIDDMQKLRTASSGKVFIQPVTQLEISATDIRNKIHQGKDIHFLVPEVIQTEIEELYT